MEDTRVDLPFRRTRPFPHGPLPLCGMNNQLSDLDVRDEVEQTYHAGFRTLSDIPSWPLDLQLPIPSPDVYFDNYHHPLLPAVFPAIHTHYDPINAPLAFPDPIGILPADRYNILGVTLHGPEYVNAHPEKIFTKYMYWFLEVNDHLISSICPSDLNDAPCEWDELQGGCPMLRLCKMRHKFPHPHWGVIPECTPDTRDNCKFVHDIEANCRSIGKQLKRPFEEQFRTYQMCTHVGKGGICRWGHDLESARAESVREYWNHKETARAHGSIGIVTGDIWSSRQGWRPLRPLGV